jgi:hypothetical protein
MDNSPQLTITDLINLQQTVEIACTRGAFRAEEMKQVGTVYDQLSAFLAALKTQAETQAQQADAPAETAPPVDVDEAVEPPQGD